MSGKTSWVTELMSAEEDGMFDRELGQTYYFYRVRQSGRSEALGGAQFQFEGLPTMQWMRETLGVPRAALTHGEGEKRKTPTVIIDDQGTDITMETANLFTVASHHFRCNIICIVHSLFGKTPAHRLMSLNSKYLVIFKNPRDQSTIERLARQVDPGNVRRFVSIYRDATLHPYSYLFVDLAQETKEDYRLRSNILFERGPYVILYKRERQREL